MHNVRTYISLSLYIYIYIYIHTYIHAYTHACIQVHTHASQVCLCQWLTVQNLCSTEEFRNRLVDLRCSSPDHIWGATAINCMSLNTQTRFITGVHKTCVANVWNLNQNSCQHLFTWQVPMSLLLHVCIDCQGHYDVAKVLSSPRSGVA